MALLNLSALKTQLENRYLAQGFWTGGTISSPRLNDTYRLFSASNQGTSSIPVGGVTLDKTDTSALNSLWPNQSTSNNFPIQLEVAHDGTFQGAFLLVDRLSHSGGGSGTIATTQSIPTAALTRYTSGAGVQAGMVIWASIGATSTTYTVSYTNQAGTIGQTTQAQITGVSGYNGSNRLIPLSLANGDTGVRSVESLTLAASTGTAGNIGFVLYKPLAMFILTGTSASCVCDVFGGNQLGMLNFDDNACLNLFSIPVGATTQISNVTLSIGVD